MEKREVVRPGDAKYQRVRSQNRIGGGKLRSVGRQPHGFGVAIGFPGSGNLTTTVAARDNNTSVAIASNDHEAGLWTPYAASRQE